MEKVYCITVRGRLNVETFGVYKGTRADSIKWGNVERDRTSLELNLSAVYGRKIELQWH